MRQGKEGRGVARGRPSRPYFQSATHLGRDSSGGQVSLAPAPPVPVEIQPSALNREARCRQGSDGGFNRRARGQGCGRVIGPAGRLGGSGSRWPGLDETKRTATRSGCSLEDFGAVQRAARRDGDRYDQN